ncbi:MULTISPECIES: hypothetical protein [unclassified Bartonella]|uniref:hypothetical protein n=1 Tax=unclassified Bartonella TaxID=2645622 RepID=UPI0009C34B4C|nr:MULTISPECIES: hypothetical protein [unclassified Bartonella]AQX28571.1 hypothetical protein BJB15x_012010 [Bartonella sp. JB15]AQX29831.1 hypothetical protein BJB63x_011800 [Bartonella sp. JB63]
MPTLTRFLIIFFILIAALFSIMIALIVYVEPVTVDMRIHVPLDLLNSSSKENE